MCVCHYIQTSNTNTKTNNINSKRRSTLFLKYQTLDKNVLENKLIKLSIQPAVIFAVNFQIAQTTGDRIYKASSISHYQITRNSISSV